MNSTGSTSKTWSPQSVYGCLPHELAGPTAAARTTAFSRIQRPWDYLDGMPQLGRRLERATRDLNTDLPRIISAYPSRDGSEKLTLDVGDGHRIETVWMPRTHLRTERLTICVSSQVGCAMGCTFCATGRMGLLKNLDAASIVGQVLLALKRAERFRGHDVNVVFMGMGEPLANLSHVRRAIHILCHPAGLGISPKRITVSTSGHLPGIQQLASMGPSRPLLALSVGSAIPHKRRKTMPIEDIYPLGRVIRALAAWPFRKRERILLEYVLLAGENDTPEDARQLARMARCFPSTINLIPLNTHEHTTYGRVSARASQEFTQTLRSLGAFVTRRRSRGQDVGAACGQLVQIGDQQGPSLRARS